MRRRWPSCPRIRIRPGALVTVDAEPLRPVRRPLRLAPGDGRAVLPQSEHPPAVGELLDRERHLDREAAVADGRVLAAELLARGVQHFGRQLPGQARRPLTASGLRHCEFGTGVLTTIGDVTGPVVVAVVAECLDDEQAVTQRTSTAARARRATAPSPAGSFAAPRGRPGAGRRSPPARRRRASGPAP